MEEAVTGRYRIEQEIGRGGAARVFRARDLIHDRAVAIKLLYSEFELSPERFLREIRMLARLQHPNIIPLFDSGHAGDTLYYVMPLVEGETLRRELNRRGQLDVAEAMGIALEAADALAYAHACGLVHRDVKPENILLSGGHAMLSDFGIARAIARSLHGQVTDSGMVIGTPAYMSPEQALGDGTVDQRSDQYSLACVVFEMLAGETPLRGTTPHALLQQLAHGTVPDIRKLRSEVPPTVANALRRALAPAPADRFASVSDFADALVGQVGDTSVRPSSSSARLVAFATHTSASKTKRNFFISFTAVGCVVLVSVLLFLQFGGTTPGVDTITPVADALDPRRIAVLYFDDHSADHSLEYLASGLTESLIHELSDVAFIEVISRNGVKPYRDRAVPVESIAQALRVGSIVEGSVQRSGSRIRVTVQLIDARTGARLGSSNLDREMGELFLLEDELARRVSVEFRKKLGVEVRYREQTAATHSVRARELVWRADRLRDDADIESRSSDADGLRRAVALGASADSLLAAAETADGKWIGPVLDRGWVALEQAGRQSSGERSAAYTQSIAFSNRALRRDSTNAIAHELRGTSRYLMAEAGLLDSATSAQHLVLAESDLRRAIDEDSTLASAWGMLSRVRQAAGDVAESERLATRALAMDAYLKDAPTILLTLFGATLMNDDLPASWHWCERGSVDYPNDASFLQCQLTLLAEDPSKPANPRLAQTLLARARVLDPPERASARGKAWIPIYRQMQYAVVLARAGMRDSARAMLASARHDVGDDAVMRVDLKYEEALLELVSGNRENCVRLLTQYVRERPYLAGLVKRHPRWKPLWNEPTFKALVATGNPP
ncbi:MAG: protein kinase [Gemmatimonadaceae bacterium]